MKTALYWMSIAAAGLAAGVAVSGLQQGDWGLAAMFGFLVPLNLLNAVRLWPYRFGSEEE